MSERKRIIVVLGMHRSGTSAMAKMLECLGANLGKDLLAPHADNPKGYFEDREINILNERILGKLENGWDTLETIDEKSIEELEANGILQEALNLLEKKLISRQIFALKEPRITKLIGIWDVIFERIDADVDYILALRNPMSVADSLEKRDNMPRLKAYYLWQAYIGGILEGVHHKLKAVIDYDNLISTPREEIKRLGEALNLKVNPEKMEEYTTVFLEQELRHNFHTMEALNQTPTCPQIVNKTYTCLRSVANDTKTIEKCLDNIKIENDLTLLLKSYDKGLKRLKVCMHNVNNLKANIESKEKGFSKEQNKFKRQMEFSTKELAIKNKNIDVLNTLNDHYKKEIKILSEEIQELKVKLGTD